jgi:hypothetical protein
LIRADISPDYNLQVSADPARGQPKHGFAIDDSRTDIYDARLHPIFTLFLGAATYPQDFFLGLYFNCTQLEGLDFRVSDTNGVSHRLNILLPIHVRRVPAS